MRKIQKKSLVTILCLMVTAASHGQSPDSDSQTLRAILAELRAMHEDIRVTETTQVLVAELQMQQGVVNRATESADNAREKFNNVHRQQQQIAAELERTQDRLDNATSSEQKSALSQRIEQFKSTIDLLKNSERDSNANLQDMQQRLQNAQDKLANIEAELSSVVSRLAPQSK